MAYFARRLRYGAEDGEAGAHFIALLEMVKRKSGRPVMFVLYRHIMQYHYPEENRSEIIRLSAKTAEEAIKRFWPSGVEGTGKEFPGYRSKRWEKTTLWLYRVAVGGGYERFASGTWVKVGRPAPWSKRRRKQLLQFGNISHILLKHQRLLGELEEEKSELTSKPAVSQVTIEEELEDDAFVPEEYGKEYVEVFREIQRVEEEIERTVDILEATKREMRYKVRKMFPKPAGQTPKRLRRTVPTCW